MIRLTTLLLMVLLLAGCAPIIPVPDGAQPPELFVSPLSLPGQVADTRLWLPYVPHTPNKLGIAGGSPEMARQLGAAGYYHWGLSAGPSKDFLSIPMVWGRFAETPRLPAGTKTALLFNEPDHKSQANLTPGEAAVLARQLFAVYPDVAWGAPVPSPLHPEWLEQWLDTYKCLYGSYPPVAFLTAHCNQDAELVHCTRRLEDLRRLAQRYGLPERVWLTELSLRSEAEVDALLPWLDSQDWIEFYFIYVSRQDCGDGWTWNCGRDGDPSLFDESGNLTERGRWYRAYQARKEL